MSTSVPLSLLECRKLLDGGVVGRVAMSTPVGPRIALVNYRVQGDAVVFRTAPYSELSSYGWDTDLAFEIDDYDRETQSAWSVVGVGPARVMDDPDRVQRLRREHELWSWGPGSRYLVVELSWRDLTGVRWGADWTQETASPRRTG